jgi:tRNA threonylcarbamoyladenosine biosynthesis protein TsaE
MPERRFKLGTPEDTERLGAALALVCRAPCLIGLSGQLGAGKTTLVRGFLRALGCAEPVKSPTFTLIESYEDLKIHSYHYDLYRLNSPEELEYLGIRDLLAESAIHLVEWPERAAGRLGDFDVSVTLAHAGESRLVEISASNPSGTAVLAKLNFSSEPRT